MKRAKTDSCRVTEQQKPPANRLTSRHRVGNRQRRRKQKDRKVTIVVGVSAENSRQSKGYSPLLRFRKLEISDKLRQRRYPIETVFDRDSLFWIMETQLR